MACPPVRADNARALTSGLPPVQVENNGITILHHLYEYISVYIAYYDILRAKVN